MDARPALTRALPLDFCCCFLVCGGSLWPLLTGSVKRERRPSLADAFYLSRSLWLHPLLAWASEPWLPRRAREAAAHFVQNSLLPFLKSRASSSTPARLTADGLQRAGREDRAGDGGSGGGGGSGSSGIDFASRGKKVLRLQGNKLGGIEEEEYGQHPRGGWFDRVLSEEEEEAKVLQELASAAIAATPSDAVCDTAALQPARSEEGARRVGLSSTGSANPFARGGTLPGATAASLTIFGDASNAGSGSARTPWTQRLQAAAKPGAPARAKTPSVSSSRSSLPRVDGSEVCGGGSGDASAAAPPSDTLGSFLFDDGVHHQRSTAHQRSRQESDTARPTRRLAGNAHTACERTGEARGAAAGVGVQDVSRAAASGPTPSIDDSIDATLDSHAGPSFDVGSGAGSGKKFVTAAEAAAAGTLRAQVKIAQKEATVASAAATAPKKLPPGALVKIWKEMCKVQAAEKAAAGCSKAPQQHAGQRAKTPLPKAAAPSSATASSASDAQAAFAAAEQASVARGKNGLTPSARPSEPAPVGPAGAVATLDHASFAKSTAADLHRLVLSSWTVEELRAVSSKPRGGGALREVTALQKNAGGRDRDRDRERDGAGRAPRAIGSGDPEEGEISEGTVGRREVGLHGDGKASGRHGRDSGAPAGAGKWLSSSLWLSKVTRPRTPLVTTEMRTELFFDPQICGVCFRENDLRR